MHDREGTIIDGKLISNGRSGEIPDTDLKKIPTLTQLYSSCPEVGVVIVDRHCQTVVVWFCYRNL